MYKSKQANVRMRYTCVSYIHYCSIDRSHRTTVEEFEAGKAFETEERLEFGISTSTKIADIW